jgi:hypothetical protein
MEAELRGDDFWCDTVQSIFAIWMATDSWKARKSGIR